MYKIGGSTGRGFLRTDKKGQSRGGRNTNNPNPY